MNIALNNWLDEVEGKPIGYTNLKIKEEVRRQGLSKQEIKMLEDDAAFWNEIEAENELRD